MKQREPVVNQNGRSEAVSGCLRRSAEQVGVPCQGEGRGFESRRPLQWNPLLAGGSSVFVGSNGTTCLPSGLETSRTIAKRRELLIN